MEWNDFDEGWWSLVQLFFILYVFLTLQRCSLHPTKCGSCGPLVGWNLHISLIWKYCSIILKQKSFENFASLQVWTVTFHILYLLNTARIHVFQVNILPVKEMVDIEIICIFQNTINQMFLNPSSPGFGILVISGGRGS